MVSFFKLSVCLTLLLDQVSIAIHFFGGGGGIIDTCDSWKTWYVLLVFWGLIAWLLRKTFVNYLAFTCKQFVLCVYFVCNERKSLNFLLLNYVILRLNIADTIIHYHEINTLLEC